MSQKINKNTQICYGNLINGQWIEGEETFEVINKYTNEIIAYVTKSTKKDVNDAVSNAVETFKTKQLSPYQRYEILLKAADMIKAHKDELALTIVHESGKVLRDARSEIDRGIQTFIASAEEAKRIAGKEVPIQGQPGNQNKLAFTIRVPVGVICAITPFNFPFNLVAHKIAPAIAAGNAVVLKPAEKTPLSAMKMADILLKAGLPSGFLNIVNGFGNEIGMHLLKDERFDMFTFTGSPNVGKYIKNMTGIRKVVLELGNNSPNIIHNDVPNLAKAVDLCITKAFVNTGQACISVQRIFVHRDIYNDFLNQAIDLVKTLKIGNPELEETDIGPMISESEAKRAENWILEAEEQGASIVYGGSRDGAVLTPTILTNTTSKMKVMCEEVFAPVICVVPYDDFNEAIEAANDSRYGLQVGLFTSNIQLAIEAVHKLQFGGVIINDASAFRADVMPYGGLKDSGFGKEGPHYAIQEMTDEKIVVINM